MALSEQILSLLRVLHETGADIEACIDYVKDMAHEDPLFPPEEQAEHTKNIEKIRKTISSLVKAKQEPSREFSDELIQELLKIFGDEDLDEYFTVLEVRSIPGLVERWKKLRALTVGLLPGDKVTSNLRQATTCYLYGLFNGATILCRSVLEFAVEEALEALGGLDLGKLDRADYLEKLINFAGNARLLPPDLATKAQNVRRAGNKAVHKSISNEAATLEVIRSTGEIIGHIYGRKA